jgi:hypothetical protein
LEEPALLIYKAHRRGSFGDAAMVFQGGAFGFSVLRMRSGQAFMVARFNRHGYVFR